MTRREFIDNVNTWDDLVEFCSDENLDALQSVYDDDSLSNYIEENLYEYVRDHNWECVRDTLNSIPSEYDYYYEDGWLEFVGLTDADFEDYKRTALEEMDDLNYWDDAEEELIEDNIPNEDDIPNEFEPDTTVALDKFFISTTEDLDKIAVKAKETEIKAIEDFKKFAQRVTTVGDYY